MEYTTERCIIALNLSIESSPENINHFPKMCFTRVSFQQMTPGTLQLN